MLGYNAEMCLRHVSWVSLVSLNFPFLTIHSVFSIVYFPFLTTHSIFSNVYFPFLTIHSVFSNVYVPMGNNNTTPLKHKLI